MPGSHARKVSNPGRRFGDHRATTARAELERPFGYIGARRDHGYEVEIVGLENPLPHQVDELPGAHLLYDLESAASALLIGRIALYELIRSSQIDHVSNGRRKLISRAATERFIEAHSRSADPELPSMAARFSLKGRAHPAYGPPRQLAQSGGVQGLVQSGLEVICFFSELRPGLS